MAEAGCGCGCASAAVAMARGSMCSREGGPMQELGGFTLAVMKCLLSSSSTCTLETDCVK